MKVEAGHGRLNLAGSVTVDGIVSGRFTPDDGR